MTEPHDRGKLLTRRERERKREREGEREREMTGVLNKGTHPVT
jgi:hypothetical protein